MLNGIVEFLGWFGAVTVLAGYILFSTGKLPNGPTYQVLNLVGGLAIAVNVGAHHAIPSLIVNGIWAIVAVVVLSKMLRVRRAEQRGAPVEPALAQLLVEPPTTTAVLPVVGPALRDHEATTDHATTEHATTDRATTDHATTDRAATGLDAAVEQAPSAPAPMTETVPVITATIALALVAAAHQEHAQQAQQEHVPQEQARQEHAQQEHVQQHAGSEHA